MLTPREPLEGVRLGPMIEQALGDLSMWMKRHGESNGGGAHRGIGTRNSARPSTRRCPAASSAVARARGAESFRLADLVLSDDSRCVPADSRRRRPTATATGLHRRRRGVIRACRAPGPRTTCRGIPFDRPEALGTQESLSEEQFIERAKRQQAGSGEHAANVQTFHRVAYLARAFSVSRRSSSSLRTAAHRR